ncbi:MAG: periplasmic heavy metal sensor [Deltaproteobacteria bacterium]|nr:periplasmic heavy metal sensor [Deltaproteobacteria bacterium]
MFGFVIGSVCLAALAVVVARGRHGGWHHHGRHLSRRRHLLHAVLARLDTTPGQEKAIRQVVEGLREKASAARRTALGARAELATALRAERFDRAVVDGLVTRGTAGLSDLRGEVVDALAAIHEVLDERQRSTLAGLVEAGPGLHLSRGC